MPSAESEAVSLFRSKPVSEIRNVEASTRAQIQLKQEELRQLVGTRYRDLIDSADSIVLMKNYSQSIASNLSSINSAIRSLSSETPKFNSNPNLTRARTYGIACRVKYLVDTPENIWGCLDESMFLEAAARYSRAKHVHDRLMNNEDRGELSILSSFPLLQHQWQIVESFKAQISQRGRDRLLEQPTAALLGAGETASPKLEEFNRLTRDLCIRAHNLWILWLSDELSTIVSRYLGQDDALSSTTPLRGWEETVVKQEQADEGQSEMKISLPSMPSLYIMSFLFRACEEVHRIGGHVLDKMILQKFALRLLEKVMDIYGEFLSAREAGGSQLSEKGVLQILVDLKFAADVLSGGDSSLSEELSTSMKPKLPFGRKQDQGQKKSVIRERIDGLINRLSKRLDPIDWLTYEPYLWENERQSYLRHAVLFGFFVQLNRMYTDTVQKLPNNSESNIMRCSTVPRFKYLPISAPALSSRGTTKTSISTTSDDISSRTSWKAYANGELSRKMDLDDNSSFGVAAPLLKSFMQVGSRFGESTLKLGSILTDGQVGIFKDRSAAAMSTFGDILPVQAAGLLSSFTASRSDS
ncbi:hypothetical protein F2P56_023265 [Juglans regia]|uniref:Conserved oligomeric Golgi complex subunit 1 n=1 Tax=Juglans regia TaxID=51240 RepID=A0A833X417_JUGRE|nr:hypothetical protein F2P56_023265 [Juglans regia]